MSPLRIGLVGLTAQPDAWANIAHLPRLTSSPNLTIVALCNSSLESGAAALKTHSLPPSTKTYADIAALAHDEDVDLIAISTRVDTHYALAKAALSAMRPSQSIYVEWPLASNVVQARELAALAREKGVRTIVGLQGRVDPAVNRAKEIVASGRLGRVHSVHMTSATGLWQDNMLGKKYGYFADKRVGGNVLTIYGGHGLDTLFFVHGELAEGEYRTLLGNLRPRMGVQEEEGKVVQKDTPDQILLQGRFAESGAVLSFHQRAGKQFPGSPGFSWSVYGDKAEMLVEVMEGASPHFGYETRIRVADGRTGEVEEVRLEQGFEGLGKPGANIGRLYELFAEEGGKERDGGRYADWEVAVKRHELIERFYEGGM